MIDYKSMFGYTPNLTFTLEQHLKNHAECEENARRLLESFHIIREKMIVNLRPVIALFPHYSEHSHEHSEHIISAIENLLGRSRIEKLSPADTWMLLISAYMHDIGMLVQGKELETDWNTPEFQQHIQNCMSSNDNELKTAAINVTSVESINNSSNWPVHIYRDVILLASEFYRRKHPERAIGLPQRAELKYALNSVTSGDGRIPHRIQDTIGKICHSHGVSFEDMLDFLEPVDSLLGYVFHPRFIAAMLCIGDLCDLDNGRFNSMAIEVFGGATTNNLVHYYKHESVKSFVIQKDFISVIFDIPNKQIKQDLKNGVFSIKKIETKDLQDFCDSILLETQNWISWMVETVKNIKLYWNDFHCSDIEPLFPTLNYKILVDSKETISSKKNMRFSFSNDKAYELIESYSLYNNKFVFIRELLQNSTDALKKQFWTDILSGRWDHYLKHLEQDGVIDYSKIQPFDFSDTSVFDYYQVKIHVNHREGEPFAKFVIEDNGTGISKSDVENRIIKTGYRDDISNAFINQMPEWLKPTSAFGVGLHSVFAITEKIFVQTRTANDETVYNINMHSGKLDGYIFMGTSEQQNIRFCNSSRGTRMEFSINVSNCMENITSSGDYDDPMAERPESIFCNVFKNMLTHMLHLSLFDITYQFNHDKAITCKKFYKDTFTGLFFKPNRRNHLLDKTYTNPDYDFALNMTGEQFIIWDRHKAILMIFILTMEEFIPCDIFCKGFAVENAKITYEGYGKLFAVHYWGGNTKDILNVSRDKLSRKQLDNNTTIFANASKYMAEIYYNLLDSLLSDNAITQWHTDISEFMEPWMSKNDFNMSIPDFAQRLILFCEKYSMLLHSEENLKCIILQHGFTLLIRYYKEHINEILNGLDNKERVKYIYEFQPYNIKNDSYTSIQEKTSICKFIEDSLELFSNENYKTEIIESFLAVFRTEYATMFLNYSHDILYKICDSSNILDYGSKIFGEIYTSKFTNMLFYIITEQQNQYLKLSKMEAEGITPTPLDVYLSIPLTNIVYFLISQNIDLTPLKNTLIAELSYLPGYTGSYGFMNVNNVGDILLSSQLKIEDKNFSENLQEFFPFLSHLTCSSIEINPNGNLVLQLDKKQNTTGFLKCNAESFGKLLSSHNYMQYFPVPIGYEAIAIKQASASTHYKEHFFFYSNYVTYLWDDFETIIEQYSPRLKSGETKETIINEIFPNSHTDNKPIINLLRYIYHNRAYKNDLPFEEAWRNICETYRSFVAFVLDCVLQQ